MKGPGAPGRWIEMAIGRLLRGGVILSLTLVVFGTIVSFVHHPEYLRDPATLDRLTTPGAASPQTVGEVLAGVRAWRGESFVALGLLVLMATPVLRVALSLGGFLYEGDRAYAAITGTVLMLLILSFALGATAGG
jgi:uncharacterized membrane protein